jgi:hypothetical protein
MKSLSLLLFLFMLFPTLLQAQAQATTRPFPRVATSRQTLPEHRTLTVYTLTVYPAPAPQPALKYTFLPRVADQVPGNGATIYDTGALMAQSQSPTTRPSTQPGVALTFPDDFLDIPYAQLPIQDTRDLLRLQHLDYYDLAARRQDCRWDWAIREMGFNALLPQLSGILKQGKWLRLRTRLEIVDGRYDDAIRSIQTGFSTAKNLGRDGTLVNALVGARIGRSMLESVREISAGAGAPNLYWALAELGRPMFSMAHVMEQENMAARSLGHLRDLRYDAPTSDAQLQQLTADLAERLNLGDATQGRVAVAMAASGAYPTARQYFIDRGMTEAQLHALPELQVTLLYFRDDFQNTLDEIVKWCRLPYWEGFARMKGAVEQSSEPKAVRNPLNEAIAGTHRAWVTMTNLDRNLAAQQIVEAIRGYAADHGGQAPKSLDELHDFPAPLDPAINKPFVYQAEGNRFTLATGESAQDDQLRYVVTIEAQ